DWSSDVCSSDLRPAPPPRRYSRRRPEPPERTLMPAPEGPPPAGTVIEVRDEEWMVRACRQVRPGEYLIEAVGASDLVRGQEARFLAPTMDRTRVLLPEDTELIADGSPHFRRGRLRS